MLILQFTLNPNIHPKNEYLRRAKVQEQFVKDFNSKTNSNVEYIEAEYKPHEFMKMAKEKGLTDEPEGGLRCSACFEMRLEIVAQAAVEYGYDYFGSAITLSPKKNAQLINELEWMFKIFIMLNICLVILKRIKDTNVQLKCKDYHIFRQCYCGCVFAAMRQGIDFKQINKEAKAFLQQF